MAFRHFVLAALAVASLSSCDLFLAPLFAPHVPEDETSPILPIQAVAGWVYSDNKIKMLVMPDYSSVPPQFGVQLYEVLIQVTVDSKLDVDVSVGQEGPEVGRSTEVMSAWTAIPAGVYDVITIDFNQSGGKHVTTINTEEGHGGIVFDPM